MPGRSVVAPGAVAVGNPVRQVMGDQPIKRAVERYAVERDPGSVEGRGDFLVRKGTTCRTQHIQYRRPRRRGPSTAVGDAMCC